MALVVVVALQSVLVQVVERLELLHVKLLGELVVGQFLRRLGLGAGRGSGLRRGRGLVLLAADQGSAHRKCGRATGNSHEATTGQPRENRLPAFQIGFHHCVSFP